MMNKKFYLLSAVACLMFFNQTGSAQAAGYKGLLSQLNDVPYFYAYTGGTYDLYAQKSGNTLFVGVVYKGIGWSLDLSTGKLTHSTGYISPVFDPGTSDWWIYLKVMQADLQKVMDTNPFYPVPALQQTLDAIDRFTSKKIKDNQALEAVTDKNTMLEEKKQSIDPRMVPPQDIQEPAMISAQQ